MQTIRSGLDVPSSSPAVHEADVALPWCRVRVRCTDDELLEILFLRPGTRPLLAGGRRPPLLRDAVGALRSYARGHLAMPLLPLAFAGLPEFHGEVYETLATRVAPGRAVTYGELAAMAGRPGAARAVGTAMARNPWPLFVPCHRVIAAGGQLGGYGPGPALKRALLAHEGLRFTADGTLS